MKKFLQFLLSYPIFRYRTHRMSLLPLNEVKVEGERFVGVGETPQFLLVSHRNQSPRRWAFISYRIKDPEFILNPRLHFDRGEGFSTVGARSLPVKDLAPGEAIVRIPYNTNRIRLDPSHQPGSFGIEAVRIDEVGSWLMILMLGWRTVSKVWRNGESLSGAVFGGMRFLLRNGFKVSLKKLVNPWTVDEMAREQNISYSRWIVRYDTPGPSIREAMAAHLAAMKWKPLISVIMPVYNTPERYLRLAIESVQKQNYPNWELCIANDKSTQNHIKRILEEYQGGDARIKVVHREKNGHISAASNSALELASGEFVALLDHDDELSRYALYHVAMELNAHPEASLIYSDEDKINESGARFDPHFKSDWNVELFHSQNYVSHLGVYRTALVRSLGGFREGYEGSQDYDLALRCVAEIKPGHIRHIPRVLYHWRAIAGSTAVSVDEKSYAAQTAIKALRDYFQKRNAKVEVVPGKFPTTYRIKYPVPAKKPLVSLIIPTRDRLNMLRVALESLLEKTTYPNYEIIIMDNQSQYRETHAYFASLKRNPKIRVIPYDAPFNFSAINNEGVKQAAGELVGLLNNDVEVITPDWLDEMVSHGVRTGVGAVGAKLIYPDGRIQHGGVILGMGGVAGHAHLFSPRESPGYFGRLAVVQNFSAVTAACLLVRKKIYQEVGGFNETDLTVAFNDVDFCIKVREAGYRNVWTPYAELYHHESASRGRENTPQKEARFKKESDYMYKTWGEVLNNDPYYSPNLAKNVFGFEIQE
ncbi:MAG: glycosyltransferase family 2 protein [Deltaproteobacteria bacterium]|nr:glycosyltransferase family 2 protein [Deltaproteobacteria bacterium]